MLWRRSLSTGQRGRRTVRSLIRFKRLPRCLLYASNQAIWADLPAASCRCYIHPPARRRHQIPRAPLHRQCQTSRNFVPWRFLDAGRHSAWKRRRTACRSPSRRIAKPAAPSSGNAINLMDALKVSQKEGGKGAPAPAKVTKTKRRRLRQSLHAAEVSAAQKSIQRKWNMAIANTLMRTQHARSHE
jgi:hypothetical protein